MLWFLAITRSYIINMRTECLSIKSECLCQIRYLEICCVGLWLGWGCLRDVLLMPLPLLLSEFLIAREKAIFCLSKLSIIYHKYLRAPKINHYSFFLWIPWLYKYNSALPLKKIHRCFAQFNHKQFGFCHKLPLNLSVCSVLGLVCGIWGRFASHFSQ